MKSGMGGDADNVCAAVSDVVNLPETRGVEQPLMGGQNLDPVQGGGLTALRLSDGSKAWFAPSYPCLPPRAGCSPAQSAAVTAIPGAVFSGSLDGHIRAFSTADGVLLWNFNTETPSTPSTASLPMVTNSMAPDPSSSTAWSTLTPAIPASVAPPATFCWLSTWLIPEKSEAAGVGPTGTATIQRFA
jgi:hypothetical protein